MPLLYCKHISKSTVLSLWQVTESVDAIAKVDKYCSSLCEEYSKKYKSEHRILEKVIARILLREALRELIPQVKDEDIPLINYNKDGCPYLTNDYSISISHTIEYVSVIISLTDRVGVDVEMKREKIERIAHKFVRDDEKCDNVEEMTLTWCAKETMYKLFSNYHLHLFDIKVLSKIKDDDSSLLAQAIPINETVKINYRVGRNYVLTYAMHKHEDCCSYNKD